MLPVFIFLVVRASVPRLQSECNFISDFLDEHMSIGEAGMMVRLTKPSGFACSRVWLLPFYRLKLLRLRCNISWPLTGPSFLRSNSKSSQASPRAIQRPARPSCCYCISACIIFLYVFVDMMYIRKYRIIKIRNNPRDPGRVIFLARRFAKIKIYVYKTLGVLM